MSDDSKPSTKVTGGDLDRLWRVTNVYLPKVHNAYSEPMTKLHKVTGTADDKKYGRCHPWWVAVAGELERALSSTSGSLIIAQLALNRAIDAYVHVDGDHAKELTAVGAEMWKILKNDKTKSVDRVVGDPSPNLVLPDSWYDLHSSDEDEDKDKDKDKDKKEKDK